MKVTFLGAVQQVTGSKHILESNGFKILLDCGMYQGKRYETYELNRTLPFDAKEIDAAILSHAHADHCGALPMLVKNGYENNIFATPATADIARLIMLDSAKLQKNDYLRLLQQGAKNPLPPLYSEGEVETACARFETVPYARGKQVWQKLNRQCRFKFYDAGHVLGSAVTVIQCKENKNTKTIAFTGDLGNHPVPILREPEAIAEPAQTLIIECTYGNQNHHPISTVAALLKEVIIEAVRKKKKIIVPAFALGRTQELIYILHKLYHSGEIPVIPIYLDSPLARNITEVFTKYPEDYDRETWLDFISRRESPFSFQNLHSVTTAGESKALAKKQGPMMIIASSGMSEGGRVLGHLEHSISDPNAIIMLTGFQAEHTLGRKLQNGVTPIRVYDKMRELRARVITISELSAHADQKGLLSYVSKLKDLQKVFLVHFEPPRGETFKKKLQKQLPNLNVSIPELGDSFEI